MVLATGYHDGCSLQLCGSCLGVYHVTLTRPGKSSSYQVLTFHSDGFFNGIASKQNADYTSFEGTWKCTGRKAVEATDFLFNFATAQSAATLSRGVFKLQLGASNQVTGTLNATIYEIVSTQNPDPLTWNQVAKVDFDVVGYKLLDRCRK